MVRLRHIGRALVSAQNALSLLTNLLAFEAPVATGCYRITGVEPAVLWAVFLADRPQESTVTKACVVLERLKRVRRFVSCLPLFFLLLSSRTLLSVVTEQGGVRPGIQIKV